MANSSFFTKNPTPSQIKDIDALIAEAAAAASGVLENTNAADQSAANAAASEANAAASALQGLNTLSLTETARNAAQAAAAGATLDRQLASDSAALANTRASDALASQNAAASSASNAFSNAQAASVSETNAGLAKTAAETARDASAASATAADGSKTAAATSATNAASSATAAGTAKTASETARDASVSAKTASEAARDSAQGYTASALSYRDAAYGYRNDALAYRDVTLTYRNDAETFKNAAAASAAAAATFDPANFYTKTASDARYHYSGGALRVTTGLGLWTTAGWGKAIVLTPGYTVMWEKGATTNAWGVGATYGAFYVNRSAADDGSQPAVAAVTITDTGATLYGDTVWSAGNLPATSAGKALLNAADVGSQKTLLALGAELISSGTLSSSVATIDITIPSGFKSYKLMIRDISPTSSGTGSNYFFARLRVGGSWMANAGNYSWAGKFWSTTGEGVWNDSGSGISTAIPISANELHIAPSPSTVNIELTISPGSSSFYPTIRNHFGSGLVGHISQGFYGANVVTDGIRLFFGSGDIATGKYELYGLRG